MPKSSNGPWSRRALLKAAAAGAAGCAPGEGSFSSTRDSTSPVDTSDTAAAPTTGGKPPNVLFLFPDQWRAQAFGHRSDPNAITPRLDALAAESVRFDQAVTPSAVCTPARASLLTGQMPWVFGMDNNGGRLPDGAPTWSQKLRDAGYSCGWIGKWHLEGDGSTGWVPPGRRFGFDDFWAAHNFHHAYLSPSLYFESSVPQRPKDRWQPEWETDLALAALDAAANNDQPFCLAISWGPPHPNTASPNDWSRDIPPEVLAAIDPDALSFRPNVPRDKLEPRPIDPWGIRGYLHGYYACIRAMDAQVGRILDHLEALGLTDDTLVIFASDHGEMGGSHGLYKKSIWFEESICVPLWFRWPRAFRGQRVYQRGASLLDLAPTLLSLCTEAGPPEGLPGEDLSPWLLGLEPDAPEQVSFTGRQITGPTAWRGVRNRDYKYVNIIGLQTTGLYHLASDPFETVNVVTASEHAAAVEDLAEQVIEWQRATRDPLLSA